MELEGYSQPTYNKLVHLATTTLLGDYGGISLRSSALESLRYRAVLFV